MTKTYNGETVMQIFASLQEGYVYSDGFRGFYLDDRPNRQIIRWNNYGSSAEIATPKKLKWLLEVIFDGDIGNLKKGKGLFVYA